MSRFYTNSAIVFSALGVLSLVYSGLVPIRAYYQAQASSSQWGVLLAKSVMKRAMHSLALPVTLALIFGFWALCAGLITRKTSTGKQAMGAGAVIMLLSIAMWIRFGAEILAAR